ncbi:MAG: AI-2E family transporter [Planctomycetaceae bacterium]|nr:AI-2E family transporter [Planctomycetaceae bacterium]
MARLVSLGILVLLIIVLGVTFYHVIAPFLLPLFIAGVVSLLFRPLYRRITERLTWEQQSRKETFAAATTTAVALATFLIPLLLCVFFAVGELLTLAYQVRNSPEVRKTIEHLKSDPWMEQLAHEIQPLIGPNADEQKIAEEIERTVEQAATGVAKKTLGMAGAAISFVGNVVMGLVSAGMFIIALFFFLRDGPRLLEATQKLIPVKLDHQTQILMQFEKSVRAVVSSTFFAAIAQGLCTAIALYFLGFDRFFLIFFLTTFFAMIPLAGAPVVWIPCSIWLGYQEYWFSAIFLVLYGAVFIGTLDNLIRTYILHTDVKLHPLLAFISVLGGVQAMGLWGIFIAPIVASCLHALILIFNTELKELSKDQFQVLKETFSKDDDKEPEPSETSTSDESQEQNSEKNDENKTEAEPKPKKQKKQSNRKKS